MTEVLKRYLDQIKITNTPTNVPLQLPKLKKIGENSTPELPKLKLPKLKKVEA